MSDEDYRNLACGDNRGNVITYRVERDLIVGGHNWSVHHNGVVAAQGWTEKGRHAALDTALARVQRFIMRGVWS